MSTAPDSPASAPRQARARSRRCNADYRWTLPKALAFLEALAGSARVAEAARAVGMSRQSAYRLRERLAGGPLANGWDLAMRAGIEARRRRNWRPSRWHRPGLAALERPTQADAFGVKVTPQDTVTCVNPSL